jgi:hypothetical protein
MFGGGFDTIKLYVANFRYRYGVACTSCFDSKKFSEGCVKMLRFVPKIEISFLKLLHSWLDTPSTKILDLYNNCSREQKVVFCYENRWWAIVEKLELQSAIVSHKYKQDSKWVLDRLDLNQIKSFYNKPAYEIILLKNVENNQC